MLSAQFCVSESKCVRVVVWFYCSLRENRSGIRLFVENILEYVKENNRHPIVWEDALDLLPASKFPKDTVVQLWKCWGVPLIGRRSGTTAARSGFRIINSVYVFYDCYHK